MAKRASSTETQIKNLLVPVIQAIVRSGKFLYFLLFAFITYLVYNYFVKNSNRSTFENDTNLIQTLIKNIGKTSGYRRLFC